MSDDYTRDVTHRQTIERLTRERDKAIAEWDAVRKLVDNDAFDLAEARRERDCAQAALGHAIDLLYQAADRSLYTGRGELADWIKERLPPANAGEKILAELAALRENLGWLIAEQIPLAKLRRAALARGRELLAHEYNAGVAKALDDAAMALAALEDGR
jgi:hypothetical protein